MKFSEKKCWFWKRAKDGRGYGSLYLKGMIFKVHRISYILHKGKIPRNMVLDHLCRKRNCINPNHLEVVTQRTNILRGNGIAAKNSKKMECLRGHLFTKENTRITKVGRACRKCIRLYKK